MAVYALFLLVLLVMADWAIHRPSDATAEDAALVYCLAPAHVGSLVNAAEALGVASADPSPGTVRYAGRELPVARWRAVDPVDFRRACDADAVAGLPANALASASPDGAAGSLEPLLDILLPVIAGALLTMAADDIKQAADRRWVQADELRADWRDFEEALRSWVAQARKNEGIPPTGDLEVRRRLLEATLRKIRSQHRKSSNISKLSGDINKLGWSAALIKGWDNPDGRAQEIEGSLSSTRTLLEHVASVLERGPWPSWRK